MSGRMTFAFTVTSIILVQCNAETLDTNITEHEMTQNHSKTRLLLTSGSSGFKIFLDLVVDVTKTLKHGSGFKYIEYGWAKHTGASEYVVTKQQVATGRAQESWTTAMKHQFLVHEFSSGIPYTKMILYYFSGVPCMITFLFGICLCRSIDQPGINDTTSRHKLDNVSHHDIHVASWKYDYVGPQLLITLFIVIVCAIKIVIHHARRLGEIIPESCLLIIVGIVIGFFFLVDGAQRELRFLHFSADSFFLYLLPPIILEAAYSLKDRAFVDNLGTIVLYAVLGTILNVFIVGPLIYAIFLTGFMGHTLVLTFLECLIFSTIVAAVDPVAVLAIFEEIGVNKMLYFMVFGESLFNDAVTVVVYNLVLSLMQIDHIGIREFGLGLAAFICVSLGGMVIGFLYGFITALLTKYSTKIRVLEPAIFYGVAYLSYISAELFHFSGIISIICCGLIQSYYAAENISSKSYITIYHFSKVMSGIAESLIFIILGVTLVNEHKAWANFNAGFAVTSILLCILSRFLVVFLLAYIVNSVVVSIRKIRLQEQFIMAYGGLRGAVTFSLVFMLDSKILEQQDSTKGVLLTSAYIIIIFTTFIQGISIKPLVKSMRIRLETNETNCLKEITAGIMDNTMAGMEEIIGHRGSYYWAAITEYLSNRFIRPAIQKFPHNHSYSTFLAAYQEANMKEKFNSHAYLDIPTHSALFTEMDTHDEVHIPNNVTAIELECQDEITSGIKKEQEIAARKQSKSKLKPPPLKLDTAEDMLALRDMLQTPPHKTMHYTFDKNDANEDRHRTILNQLRHMGHIRRRSRATTARKRPFRRDHPRMSNAMLESALIPLGVTLAKRNSSASSLARELNSVKKLPITKETVNESENLELISNDKKVTFSLDDRQENENEATEIESLLQSDKETDK